MPRYPTKKQILAKEPEINIATIEVTKLWKKLALKNWNKDSNYTKLGKLEMLLITIAETNQRDQPSIFFGSEDKYDPSTQIICLNASNPSIISALHELGHYLLGSNELEACRWSIWLFKECFPVQYKKLEWKGHLLVKK